MRDTAMPSFHGTITTTGKSEAIRLEKALFRAHPEFQQKAKVRAHVIAKGQILISLVEESDATTPEQKDADPVMDAFLNFLVNDITQNPSHIEPLSNGAIVKAVQLTRAVSVDDDEEIPEDATL